MRKTIGYWIAEALICCLLLALASCNRDAVEIDVPSDGEMALNVGFTVPTRATADGYEDGETDENYIDIAGGNYRIYFFDTNNEFIATFEPSGFIVKEGSDYCQYSVLGKAPDALVKHRDFKMVVLANWPTYPEDSDDSGKEKLPLKEGTKISEICNADWARYDCLVSGKTPASVALDPSSGKLMPFYGIHEYSSVTFTEGQATILEEPVTLLRAMAKVEVILETDDYFDQTFSSLKIHRYNSKGYCAPMNVFSHVDYDHSGSYNEDYVRNLHLVDGRNDDKEKEFACRFVRQWDEKGKRYKKWAAYLPEYQNIGVNDAYSCIKAKFNIQVEGDDPHTIYFSEYNGGIPSVTRLNIERNNIYRFLVKCTGYNFKLSLTVSDWERLYENTFDFGDSQIVSPVSPWEDEKDNDIIF